MEQKTVLDLTVYEIVIRASSSWWRVSADSFPRPDGCKARGGSQRLAGPSGKARIIEADMEKGKLVLSAREVIREQQREEKRRKSRA